MFQFIAVATALCTVTRVNADSNNIINKDTNLVRASSRYDVPTVKRYVTLAPPSPVGATNRLFKWVSGVITRFFLINFT